MLDLAHPLWLLGLLLIPPIRWLHRFHAGGRKVRVPALFLWRDAGAEGLAGIRRGDPDPAWRRRALLTALLVVSLAGPGWVRQHVAQAEVWVDDGPALFAREPDGRDRVAWAAEALRKSLEQAGAQGATLHALRRPGEALVVHPQNGMTTQPFRSWLGEPGRAAFMSPPLAGGVNRWLLSSGSDRHLSEAFRDVPLARAIEVGKATENSALVGLSARPSLKEPDQLTALATVLNAGTRRARRALEVRFGQRLLASVALELKVGERKVSRFSVPAGTRGDLDARLLPEGADALPMDDVLALEIDPASMQLPFAAKGRCPLPVVAALEANPVLRRMPASEAQVSIWCGAEQPSWDTPTLWLPTGLPGGALRAEPSWSDHSTGDLPLLEGPWLRPIAAPQIAGKVLLGADGEALILEQDRPRRIILLFDTGAPELELRPELPSLITKLLTRLAGREILFPAAAAARNPDDARVAPGPLPRAAAEAITGATRFDASPWLLLTALAFAADDLSRQWRRRQRV